MISLTRFGVAAMLGLLVAVFTLGGAARGQESPGLGDMLFGRDDRVAPQARVYVVNERRFTLDRSFPGKPLLQFDGDPEVHALTSVFGARGDEFLRNDIGETLLRITTLGGVTVYGPLGDRGAPADYVGPGKPVPRAKAPVGGKRVVLTRVRRSVAQIVGTTVRLVVPERLPDAMASEMLDRVVDGMRKARTARPTAERVQRIREVKVVFSAYGGATLRGQVLWIGVSPSQGYAGRPSSAAVYAAILDPES